MLKPGLVLGTLSKNFVEFKIDIMHEKDKLLPNMLRQLPIFESLEKVEGENANKDIGTSSIKTMKKRQANHTTKEKCFHCNKERH